MEVLAEYSRREIKMRLIQINELETLNTQNLTSEMFVPVQESGHKKRAKKLRIKDYVDDAASFARIKSNIAISAGPGVSFGKYKNGDTIASSGMTFEELLTDALSTPAKSRVILGYSPRLPKYFPIQSLDPLNPEKTLNAVSVSYNSSEYGDIDQDQLQLGFSDESGVLLVWGNATSSGNQIVATAMHDELSNNGFVLEAHSKIFIRLKYKDKDGIIKQSDPLEYVVAPVLEPVIGNVVKSTPPDKSMYTPAEFIHSVTILPGKDIKIRPKAGANIFFHPMSVSFTSIVTSNGEDLTNRISMGALSGYTPLVFECAVDPDFEIIFKQGNI